MGTQDATQHKLQYIEQALSKGFTAAQIANALHSTESAVSQLISTYNISVGKSSKKAAALDDIYDNLEHKAADLLGKSLAVCELDPVRLSMVLSRLNSLKRRSYGEGHGAVGGAAGALVSLQLPQQVARAPQVSLSARNEIIEIDGRTIATIDRNRLHKMSDDRIDNLYQDSRPPVQETLTLPAAVLMQTGAASAREEVTHELNSQAQ
jgi:predicted transcriptional regulator